MPFSRAISARATARGPARTSAPPSPQLTFFVSWKLRQPASPSVPSARPRQRRGDALGRVLDEAQAAPPCDRRQGLHVRRDTGVVDGQDRGRARGDAPLDVVRVEAERPLLDVREDGSRADSQHGVGARDEGEGGAHDLAARTDAERQQRQLERVRAGGGQQHAARAEQLREARLDAPAGRPVAAGLHGERPAHASSSALVVPGAGEGDHAFGGRFCTHAAVMISVCGETAVARERGDRVLD